MSTDLEEKEDELLALQSIFNSEEFVRDQSKFAGKIRVRAELPADFTVVLKEGESQRQYGISYLPPLLLTFELPEDYPSSSPPSFTLTCSWLTHTQLAALSTQLVELYQATGGAVVLFSWVQFLREDALHSLGIHSELEIPSDGGNILQDQHNAAASDVINDSLTPESKPADEQCDDEQDPCKFDISAPATVLSSNSSDQLSPAVEGAASLLVDSEASQDDDHNFSHLSLTPSQVLMSKILIYHASEKQRVFDSTVFDCGVCVLSYLGSECVQLYGCGHIFCRTCLSEFCKLQITEGNVRSVTCPQADCTAAPTPAQVMTLVGEELFSRYDRLLLQTSLDSMPDVMYCPRPSCASAIIMEKSSTVEICSVCRFVFCVKCKKTNHGTDQCADEKLKAIYQTETPGCVPIPQTEEGLVALYSDYCKGSQERKRLLESRYGRKTLTCLMAIGLSQMWITVNTKPCPHCFTNIEKNGGCNSMFCTRCKNPFTWK